MRYSFIIFEQIILECFDSIWWSELIGNGVFIFEIIIIASHLGDIQVFVKKLVMSSVLPYRKTNDKMWSIFRNVEWCSSKLALVNIQQTGYKMALIVQLPTVFLPDKVCEELMIPFFCQNWTLFTLNELIWRPSATWALGVFWAGMSVLPDLRGNWDI